MKLSQEEKLKKKDKRAQPRWLQQLKAFIFGYFWLPCPLCGEYFGGHEEPTGYLATSYGGGTTVCANCIEKAEVINKKNSYFYPRVMTPRKGEEK